MSKPAKKPNLANQDRREPTEKETARGKAAVERHLRAEEERESSRSALPEIGHRWDADKGVAAYCAPHADANGWAAQLVESLGVTDARTAGFLFDSAVHSGIAPTNPKDEAGLRANVVTTENALAFVADVQPQNAIEAALVLQMAAAHKASMTLGRHAAQATQRDALADYSRMMNQTMRTFTAQAEALHKLRTGGKQQVEVRYVYVDARTQTVVNNGSGDGGSLPFPSHPHAPGALGYAPAPGLPVWSEDQTRDALPVASGKGAASLQDARGEKSRRSEGRGQRPVHLRAVDTGSRGRAGEGPGAAQGVQDDAA